MSTIFALMTAIALTIVGMLRRKRSKARPMPVLARRYVHQGHTWMRVTEDGEVVVGMDDFAQSLIGTIDGVKLPRLLKSVEQGGVAWHVWHGHRHVAMVSPVSGRVIEKNEMLLRNPSLINDSPYGDGWLFKIHPRKLVPQLHNLFTGRWAQALQDLAKRQLNQLFSHSPALMYQDGGVITKNLMDRCSEEEWDVVTKEFFLVNADSEN